MLVKCSACSKEVSESAKACPHCGHPLKTEPPKTGWGTGCAVVILCAIGVTAIDKCSSGPSHTAASETRTIDASDTASIKPVGPEWAYSTDIDKINGKSSSACIQSEGEISQGFPYHDTYARLCIVRNSKRGLVAYVELNTDGQILCASYDGCTIPARFDEKPQSNFGGRSSADGTSNIVFLVPASRVLSSAIKAKTLVVQLRLYQNGDQNAQFPVAGLDQARLKLQ